MGVDIMREMLEYWPDLESARGIVIIDELDTHLHPRWKMRIAQRLRHALREVQFLASTHDPLCLRGYDDGEVNVLRRDANSRVEAVVDLPSVRGLSVQQLLTSEFFGLWSSEDPELEESVARYVTLASKHDRSVSEDAELERQRVATDETIQLGSTPQDQVMQKALIDYVVQRRVAPQSDKASLERATVDKLLARMAELDSSAGVSEFVKKEGKTP
jgi:DNA repair ATPase RecN